MKENLMYYYLVIEDLKSIQKGRCGSVQRKRLLNDLNMFNRIFNLNELNQFFTQDDITIEELNYINHIIHNFYKILLENKCFPFSGAFVQENAIHDVSNLKPAFFTEYKSYVEILIHSSEIVKIKNTIENKHYMAYLNDSLAIALDFQFHHPGIFQFEELWQEIDALMEFHMLTFHDQIEEKETDEGFAEFCYRTYSISLKDFND